MVMRKSNKPVFLTAEARAMLIKLAAQATIFCDQPVSPSALVRYAIAGPLAEVISMFPEMGEPDQFEVKRGILAACEGGQSRAK
jgi:hypothetical protein